MSSKTDVIAAALKLSEAERLDVAQRLLESVDGSPPDPSAGEAWSKEIASRLARADAGARRVPWEEARRRISGE